MLASATIVTVAARSKPCTVFARLDAGIVGSNPTHGTDFCCVYAFILCLCCPVFATGLSPIQGVLPFVKEMITELNKRPGP
jgi:hypothetical protein